MFFVAVALLLVTVGVFAGSKKFSTVPSLYLYETLGGTYTLITSGTPFNGSIIQYSTTLTGFQPIKLTYDTDVYYGYTLVSGTYYPVYVP